MKLFERRKKTSRTGIEFVTASLCLCAFFEGAQTATAQPAKPIFGDTEFYVADGQNITLVRKVDEVSASIDPTVAEEAQIQGITTSSKQIKFEFAEALDGGRTVYKKEDGGTSGVDEVLADLNDHPAVKYAYPVFAEPTTGRRYFLCDEVIVQLKVSAHELPPDLVQGFGAEVVSTLSETERLYVLRLRNPKTGNPFQLCHRLKGNDQVVWAQPNMAGEVQFHAGPPNDTYYAGSQWYLNNTGQPQHTLPTADIDANSAWLGSQGYGSTGIRVAVIDDGVQTNHPDLQNNIVQGYDFYNGDTDPGPAHANDKHGTPMAGLVAAVTDNSQGIAGTAGKCKIVPVKLFYNGLYPVSSTMYRAIVYAADNADVIVGAWNVPSDSTVTAAFSYASTKGRNGKGCPILFASGNTAAGNYGDPAGYDGSASGSSQIIDVYSAVGAGAFYAEFQYVKNGSVSSGDDAVWLADVLIPLTAGYTPYLFDSATFPPSGWSQGGSANWFAVTTDPAHMHGTSGYAVRSGAITHNQTSWLKSPLMDITSSKKYIYFRRWLSSETLDGLKVVIRNSSGVEVASTTISGGQVAGRSTAVTYPANLSSISAVGACSDWEYRSHYSCFGPELAFAAPSDGGWATLGEPIAGVPPGVLSTDRTGASGYDPGDYYYFSGTSASAALAGGIAGLILSKDGNLTASSIVSKMKSNCDQIGRLAYSGGPPARNDYYGTGRLNAKKALDATTGDTTAPTFDTVTTVNYRAVDVKFSEPMGDGATDSAKYSFSNAAGGTLATTPTKVVRILPNVFRLVWTSGDMATTGNSTVTILTGIKDVAGNAVTGTTARTCPGTKRIIALNCGNNNASDSNGWAVQYVPPFNPDNDFQGNEWMADYLYGTNPSSYTTSSINTSSVVSPAPEGVYQTRRYSQNSTATIYYYIPNVPTGTKTVRLHFAEIYFNNIGEQVFDIRFNGSLITSNFDILAQTGGVKNKAYIYEFSASPVSGAMPIEIVPKPGAGGIYNAALNGIEIMKP